MEVSGGVKEELGGGGDGGMVRREAQLGDGVEHGEAIVEGVDGGGGVQEEEIGVGAGVVEEVGSPGRVGVGGQLVEDGVERALRPQRAGRVDGGEQNTLTSRALQQRRQ